MIFKLIDKINFLTLITIIVWILFRIYTISTTPEEVTTEIQLKEINQEVNTEYLKTLPNKLFIEKPVL